MGQFDVGNCRLALQEFFLVFVGSYFTEAELLNPQGYLSTGQFLKEGVQADFFDGLPFGAVIYGEIIRNKYGEEVDRSLSAFETREDYLVRLHTAIYIPALQEPMLGRFPRGTSGTLGEPAIWHATAIEGRSCLWTVEKFLKFYLPVAAKKFI
jgi:hypothetical protein